MESKIFDNIRIRPRREEKPAPIETPCDWEGCEKAGTHKAPKGHRKAGEYHNFCLEHVRHYNTAFNFFAGMDKNDLDEALHTPPKPENRRSFATGQPGAGRSATARTAGLRPGDKYGDPFGVFAKYRHRQNQTPAAERVKPLHEPDRRALEALGIIGHAKSDEIKKAYKALVKIHHPDANGGDKSSEDRLRAIIAAYSHLKKAGFVVR
ncbi:DnaJ domain-containing protein [Devosia algicola]|uniref:DnaJ domain-containing protein n=1 Tax=Devosia algicola TaxID=3026418 RepID=A0ABY7YJE3_9HYPH|nr:DnaJ domain-containing protein [Devosia algicola]WDR01409.1 DnaJ domain-containing protein [Devosia algicola]